MSRKFSIISAGPGQPGLLTDRARQAIQQADQVYACGRVAGGLAALRKDWNLCPAADLAELAADAQGDSIAVAVAGDSGFLGQVDTLADHLSSYGTVCVYPGISNIQYLCALAGESYDDAFFMEYGSSDLLAAVSYRGKVFLASSEKHMAEQACEILCAGGLGGLRVLIGSRLGTGREHIADDTAEQLRGKTFAPRSVMLIINTAPADPFKTIFDQDLTTESGSKIPQEARWNAANLLRVLPGDTVYDIAAGNGAMSMELARKAYAGKVFSLAGSSDTVDLVERNRKALGCWNVRTVSGDRAAQLESLPAPDAAFVGFSAQNLQEILSTLKEKNAQVKVVIAADNFDRLSEAQAALAALRFRNIFISEILMSNARVLGNYTMMLATKPIFLISAGKQ